MEFEIISASDFENLPDNPEEKFVAFEEICRRNMNSIVTLGTGRNSGRLIGIQYMTAVASAAVELGIDGLEYPRDWEDPYQGLEDFMLKASGIVTRFRLRNSKNNEFSVRLGTRTRGRIEMQIARLRSVISECDLPEDRRKSLLKKLDELSVELSQPRVSFSKVMAILAVVGVAVGGGASFLADAPEAIATIVSLIGADKEAEDAEAQRLGAPTTTRALAPPQKSLPAPSPERFGRDDSVDEEIPF